MVLKLINVLLTSAVLAYTTAANFDDQQSKIEYIHIVSQIQSRFAITLITSQMMNTRNVSSEMLFSVQLPETAFITNFTMKIDDKIIVGNVKEKAIAKQEYQAEVASGQSAGIIEKKPRETNGFKISVNVGPFEKVSFNLTYQELLKRTHGLYKHVINLHPTQQVKDLKVNVFINEDSPIVKLQVPKFGPKMGEKNNAELSNIEKENNVFIDHTSHSAHVKFAPSNDMQNGQFVVLYDVTRDYTGGQVQVVNGYFVHFFAPEIDVKRSKRVVFVLDKSGSMWGTKFQQTKEAMRVILHDLSPEDTFNIIMFSDVVHKWHSFVPASPENIRLAIQHIENAQAEGSTNIFDALKMSLEILRTEQSTSLVPMIVFMTDGQPTTGEQDADTIVDRITAMNDETKALIHSIAFGNDADYNLVQRISTNNKGLSRKVYEDSDANLQLVGFYGEISSPLLTNVSFRYLNETVELETLVQDNMYTYNNGGEIVTVGKISSTVRHNPSFDVLIAGQTNNGPINFRSHPTSVHCPNGEFVIEDDIIYPCCTTNQCRPLRLHHAPKKLLPANTFGGFVERMWAYQTIKKLMKQAELNKESKASLEQEALRLSLKYHFVTDLTSMVVIQTNNNTSQLSDDSKTVPQYGEPSNQMQNAYVPDQAYVPVNVRRESLDILDGQESDLVEQLEEESVDDASTGCFASILFLIDISNKTLKLQNVDFWKHIRLAIFNKQSTTLVNTIAYMKPKKYIIQFEQLFGKSSLNQIESFASKMSNTPANREISFKKLAASSFRGSEQHSQRKAVVVLKGDKFKLVESVLRHLHQNGVEVIVVDLSIRPDAGILREDSSEYLHIYSDTISLEKQLTCDN